MENEKQNNKEVFSLIDYFVFLLDRFMKNKPKYEEDKKFFEDEKNLYDEEGELTPAYQQKIKEYEQYLRENNMSDFLKSEISEDETDRSVVNTICDYSERRRVLMADYAKARIQEGRGFDPDNWVEEKIHEYAKTEEEKKELSDLMQELLAENIDSTLDDPETRVDMEEHLTVFTRKEDSNGRI